MPAMRQLDAAMRSSPATKSTPLQSTSPVSSSAPGTKSAPWPTSPGAVPGVTSNPTGAAGVPWLAASTLAGCSARPVASAKAARSNGRARACGVPPRKVAPADAKVARASSAASSVPAATIACRPPAGVAASISIPPASGASPSRAGAIVTRPEPTTSAAGA